jgi:hypothetical protein
LPKLPTAHRQLNLAQSQLHNRQCYYYYYIANFLSQIKFQMFGQFEEHFGQPIKMKSTWKVGNASTLAGHVELLMKLSKC